jgi:Fic family protein
MEKNIPIHLNEIIFGSSDSTISKKISKLEKNGEIRKIAPRIYTSNLNEPPEEIIRRNIFSILGNLYPESVLSHRSAFEFKPTSSGQIFVTYTYTKKISLPGIDINFLKGSGPIQGDNPFSGELFVSQPARAFLENLQVSRKPGPESKTLTFPEIEEKLEQIIRVNGEGELNAVRDKAKEISVILGMEKEFQKLNKIISALLTTHPSKILKSPLATARAFGLPYDPERFELFQILFQELNKTEFQNRIDRNTTLNSFRNFAFYESYFSNYIEGTVFSIEDAIEIIRTQKPLPARNEDSHDILGTYQIVSNRKEMELTPNSSEDLIKILKYRHQIILSAREDKNPGLFKTKNNFAGNTAFVDLNLVNGTLIKSFDFYQALRHPFAKAAYMMFVVSEVHPFLDGNGRIARVMMNSELVRAGHSKIIVPTVYRDDYLGALRRLTRDRDPKPYVRMLNRAQEFSFTIQGESMKEMQNILEASNAFLEHNEGVLKNITKANNV